MHPEPNMISEEVVWKENAGSSFGIRRYKGRGWGAVPTYSQSARTYIRNRRKTVWWCAECWNAKVAENTSKNYKVGAAILLGIVALIGATIVPWEQVSFTDVLWVLGALVVLMIEKLRNIAVLLVVLLVLAFALVV